MTFEVQRPKALAPWVRMLWYCRAPEAGGGRQRVLPTGAAQLILNLAGDSLTGCAEGGPSWAMAPAVVSGVRRRYELIETSDLAELIGVVFAPGGLRRFFTEPAERFSDADTALDGVWGSGVEDLRTRLREAVAADGKFAVMENYLRARLRTGQPHAAVRLALDWITRRPCGHTVEELAGYTALSARRLNQLFRSEVGFGPKRFARILRFQVAMRQLHTGTDVRWPELALECGYCDQSHFANDFREFSGLDATTYLRSERPWANHVQVEASSDFSKTGTAAE